MLSFLKVFARGIITTILLPLILLVLALYGVYCLILFVVMFFKGVIGYFKGNDFKVDLPEDLEARRMVLEREKRDYQAKEMLNMMYEKTMMGAPTNPEPQQDGLDFLQQEVSQTEPVQTPVEEDKQ